MPDARYPTPSARRRRHLPSFAVSRETGDSTDMRPQTEPLYNLQHPPLDANDPT